mgnify:FL=1
MDDLRLIEMFKRLSTTEQIRLNDRLKEVIDHSRSSEYKQFPSRDPLQTIP